MLQIVATEKPPGWRLFSAKQGWLFRFTKRWSLSLRRKMNTKRKPIITTPLYSHLGNESVRKNDFYGLAIALTKS